ncbi:MAG: hypothetical protein R3F43_17105 [bacterium]
MSWGWCWFDTSLSSSDTVVNPSYYENLGGVIRNSLVTDTRFAGIGLFATRGAHVLHNTIRRAGSDGMAGIYLGVATQDYDPAAGRPANVDPTIIGNIVDQTGLDSPSCFGIRFSVEDELGVLSGLDGSFTIDHNLYFSGAPPSVQRRARSSTRATTSRPGRPSALTRLPDRGSDAGRERPPACWQPRG